MASATSTARRPSNWSSNCATPWPGMAKADGVNPCTFCQSTMCIGPRRLSRRWVRTATLDTTQSRVRVCSIPRSATTTSASASSGRLGSLTVTGVSSTWPIASTSPGRCSKCRSETLPERSVTALGSIAATRRIGMKMLRRVAKSTTSPSTRGCWRTMLMLITTSRTRPNDSPRGPSTIIRGNRATYTLLTELIGESVGSPERVGRSGRRLGR
jgi:hypothetical protein